MPRRTASRDPWTAAERAVLRRLTTPARIQSFLDGLAYRTEDEPAAPRRVLSERRAHCLDGALLAAAALRRLGRTPALLGMWAVRDDGHVIAVYRDGGGWGAVGKSNFTGLRYRDPVYRSVRELVMSYFDDYFNADGERTLRMHTSPLPLARFDRLGWETRDEAVGAIDTALKALPDRHLITPQQARRLARVDPRSMSAGMLGTVKAGLYRG
ncbi:MAG TPA: hypothetical protein VLT47_10445 [Anaeromyxobacteraceae bacterium]|nr:hypothetical protein [Anaeromyxobacteraceae bacterium]